ncbi:hypothetical protein ONZ51_g5704 [Trametes cubensis]|uniref:Uncharacterized protein n=1 Tax=Trametes cubensis TaxID=1111947 RepID=A0AAD7TVT9_9APHY|nr:hypothetical protein ONZ51_g5704 [Trametes cubensis]
MSAQPGHTSNLRSGRPNAPIHVATQGGGRPRTMILGMAACALGFYGFYRLQFTTQNRSHTSADPAEMPTWQFRHAQQTPEFNERVSAPGGTGTNLRPRGSSAQEPTQFLHASPVRGGGTGGGAASSDMVSSGSRNTESRGNESGGATERGGESRAAANASAEDPRGKNNSVQANKAAGEHDMNVVASIMSALHGHPSEGTQNENGHVGQPAPVKRMNDRGGIYTKNSDYKDSYRRD